MAARDWHICIEWLGIAALQDILEALNKYTAIASEKRCGWQRLTVDPVWQSVHVYMRQLHDWMLLEDLREVTYWAWEWQLQCVAKTLFQHLNAFRQLRHHRPGLKSVKACLFLWPVLISQESDWVPLEPVTGSSNSDQVWKSSCCRGIPKHICTSSCTVWSNKKHAQKNSIYTSNKQNQYFDLKKLWLGGIFSVSRPLIVLDSYFFSWYTYSAVSFKHPKQLENWRLEVAMFFFPMIGALQRSKLLSPGLNFQGWKRCSALSISLEEKLHTQATLVFSCCFSSRSLEHTWLSTSRRSSWLWHVLIGFEGLASSVSVDNLSEANWWIVKDAWILLQQLSSRLDIQGFNDSDSGVERLEIPGIYISLVQLVDAFWLD